MSKMYDKIVELSASEITPYEGSHNTSETVEALVVSIQKYGLNQPISVDKNKVIVTGNAVYKAGLRCGIEKFPCVILEDLSEDEIAQYRIADDKTSEFAKWNTKKLMKELSYLQSPSSLQFCFDQSINDMLGINPIKIAPAAHPKGKENGNPAPTREELDQKFKSSLNEVEKGLKAKPTQYVEYVCSRCGKSVSVRL